jgi:sRNA-binding regulator protein Hfq
MNSDSTLYTIGTALNRARDNGIDVEILVAGHWLDGQVVAVDGHGIVLDSADHQHAVVRIESVSAVKIGSPSPIRRQITEARPMPAPRIAYDDAGESVYG